MPAGEPKDSIYTFSRACIPQERLTQFQQEAQTVVVAETTQLPTETEPNLLEHYKDFTLGGLVVILEAECAARDKLIERVKAQDEKLAAQGERIRELEVELATADKHRNLQTRIIHEQGSQLAEQEKKIRALADSRASLYEDLGRHQAVISAARVVDKGRMEYATHVGNLQALAMLHTKLGQLDNPTS